jgi:branched-chain amino acid transport system substrate-binding protein
MKRSSFTVAMLAMCAFVSSAFAAEPVKIGFMFTFTGRQAVHGSLSQQGAEVAINEINKAGGILGRQVEGVFVDDKANPKEGAELARKLTETVKVDAIIGLTVSDVAVEVSQAAKALRVPLIITTAQTQVVTGPQCNPYTFRICRNTHGMVRTATALAAGLNVKEWNTVGPDYIFGKECWELFQKYLRPLKPSSGFASPDRTVFAPMTNTDWKPQIQKVIQSGSDGIVVSLYGGNLMDFLKQAHELGLFDGKRSVIALLGSLQTLMSVGVEMPEGVWVTPPYFFTAIDTAANQKFVAEYQSLYGSPPDYQAQFAYCGVMAFAEAARKAGSTDKNSVAAALEGLELELPVGRTTIRKDDHQALMAGFAGATSAQMSFVQTRSRKVPFRKLERGIFFKAEEVSPIVEDSGCRMDRSALGAK